jgi:DNA ligase (NAD+)
LIAKLVAAGLVQGPADLYRLSREQLASVAGVNQAEKLHAAIARSRSAPPWRVLAALGIARVGPVTAKRLLRQFGSLDAFAQVESEDLITTEGKSRVAGVGDATARAIAESLSQPAQRRQLQELHAVGFSPAADSAPQGLLKGRRVALTGALPTLSRAEATRLIIAAGGVVASRVTRETDYVVAGERPGVKLAAARQLGIKVLDEAGLRALLAGHEGD